MNLFSIGHIKNFSKQKFLRTATSVNVRMEMLPIRIFKLHSNF